VTGGSALLPWIDHVDPGFSEVFGVAGGQRRAAGSADGGYLGIEAVNREAEAITVGHDRGVPDRGIGIEGLNEFAERGEHFRGCSQQAVLSASAGQSLEAVADLGDGDGRGAPPSSPKRSMIAWNRPGASPGTATASARMARTSASIDLPWRAARTRSRSFTRSSRLRMLSADSAITSSLNASNDSRWPHYGDAAPASDS
jgi:hypothetical protein